MTSITDTLIRRLNSRGLEINNLRKQVASLDRMTNVMRQEIDVLEKALTAIDPQHPAITQSLAIFRAYLEESDRLEASDG